MNEKVLKTLEYDKIIARLLEKCATPLGREEAKALCPGGELPEIEKNQAETAAALSLLYRVGNISCSGARDIRDSLLRLKVQGTLGIVELMNVSALLRTAERVKGAARKDEEAEPDVLDPYFDALSPVPALYREIDRCILSEEEIADDASVNLRNIRRRKTAAAAKIRSELNALVVSQSSFLRENVITMRNGRYCVPVKAEYRNQISGMVHDESGSGSTVFLEPMSVIRLNNEIRELEIAEQKEIEVILAKLSEFAYNHASELDTDLKVLSHLDFVFGKGALAKEMKATRPVFRADRVTRIKKGRHPLLDPKKVVPIDLTLGETFRQLIVTGPNTGGKTVSLKTVGLFQLMGQAGLHIPAYESSELGVFTEIFADIGDEQSIEQSLSTFSSHMKNIVRIIEQADGESLVLLDELCAGTDPQEGAALAIAILNFLRRMEVRTMATTHYSELKLYALSTDGVENASCEFDVATLSPTYRLLVGIPGKSNAFAISRKLGIPEFIIDEAKAGIDEDAVHFEDIIRDLNEKRREMEHEEYLITQLKGEASRLRDDLEKQEAKLEAQREKILGKAREEARGILQDAKDQADETIRMMNKAGKDVRELEQIRTKTREKLGEYTVYGVQKPSEKSNTKADELKAGDRVHVISMNMDGVVESLPDKSGKLYVQMGILRSKVALTDVRKLPADGNPDKDQEGRKGPSGAKSGGAPGGLGKSATISPEINLIGMTVDAALPELDKYLDDAYLSSLQSVRIVHGKGSGILR
ncbi:MAG: endonuclease MutS2, partial [Lachnospiraceae bacterium]|nr:endonuclease MutS2 [Lachnospiraceae bacterium]